MSVTLSGVRGALEAGIEAQLRASELFSPRWDAALQDDFVPSQDSSQDGSSQAELHAHSYAYGLLWRCAANSPARHAGELLAELHGPAARRRGPREVEVVLPCSTVEGTASGLTLDDSIATSRCDSGFSRAMLLTLDIEIQSDADFDSLAPGLSKAGQARGRSRDALASLPSHAGRASTNTLQPIKYAAEVSRLERLFAGCCYTRMLAAVAWAQAASTPLSTPRPCSPQLAGAQCRGSSATTPLSRATAAGGSSMHGTAAPQASTMPGMLETARAAHMRCSQFALDPP